MSNSPLVSYTKISPNKTSPRNHKIDTITIHCVVGQLSVEKTGDIFAARSRRASSNYGIGPDGKIGMYVEEKDRSWCSSNAANDNRAITIEVASDTTHPYAITDEAYQAVIKLCADICKRNGIKELKWKADKSLIGKPDQQNMTVHRWFAKKACPGDYIYNRLGTIAAEVNTILEKKPTVKPAAKPSNATNKSEDVLYRVQTGAFKNKEYADAYFAKVKAAGFKPCMVKVGSLHKVQVGAYKKQANAEAEAKKLEAAGFTAVVTNQNGEKETASKLKSLDVIAKEVLSGKWGNGTDRKNRLSKAGYDYEKVQKRVNELNRK